MAYHFRIRLQLANTVRIGGEEPELVLAKEPQAVKLGALDGETPMKECILLTLTGGKYLNEESAFTAGQEWISAVQVAFARMKIGADFGYRKQGGHVGQALRDAVRESHGVELMAEPHRLVVYRDGLDPMFLSGSATGYTDRRASDIAEEVARAREQRAALDEQQTLAYHLFSASFFEINPDSRLMILMMAIETLIEPARHSGRVCDQIDELIRATKKSNLSREETAALNSALSQLKKESIGAAGRRLARSLQGRTYGDDEAPETFFARCYRLRNKLAHGAFPRPESAAVASCVFQLRQFAGDLIAAVSVAGSASA